MSRAYNLTRIALCVSLLTVCSYIVLPVPFSPAVLSMHSVAVCAAGFALRPKHAAAAVGIYLLMGFIGLPVFAGATGGAGRLFGPTGGFYFGFLLCAVMVSALMGGRFPGAGLSYARCVAVCLLTVPVMHLCAVLMMCAVGGVDIRAAFFTVSLPFLPGDIAKAFLSAALGRTIVRTEKSRV